MMVRWLSHHSAARYQTVQRYQIVWNGLLRPFNLMCSNALIAFMMPSELSTALRSTWVFGGLVLGLQIA